MTWDRDDLGEFVVVDGERLYTDPLRGMRNIRPDPAPVVEHWAPTPSPADDGETGEVKAAELLARVRNGSWLDAQQFPPLGYHLPGIVPEGSTLLVGPPKIGKSWFVLALGLAAAAGGRALGQPVDPRPVLYLALEDGDRRLQERCRMLLADDPIPDAFEYVTVVDPGMVLATIRAWLELQLPPPPLVILDTLGRVMPPALLGESSYQRDYRIGAAIKRLADDHPGAGVVVNHHDRKAAADDFVEKVSGSNGLAGSADTIIVLARPRHESAALLQVTGRDVPEGEYALTFDGPTGLWALDGPDLAAAAKNAHVRRATSGVGDLMADVIAFVGDNPDGVSPADVADELGYEPATVRKYLTRAVAAGRLRRVSRGLYSPITSVTLSRTEAPERDNATEVIPLLEVERPSDDNRGLFR